jgi:hypothetical protein
MTMKGGAGGIARGVWRRMSEFPSDWSQFCLSDAFIDSDEDKHRSRSRTQQPAEFLELRAADLEAPKATGAKRARKQLLAQRKGGPLEGPRYQCNARTRLTNGYTDEMRWRWAQMRIDERSN